MTCLLFQFFLNGCFTNKCLYDFCHEFCFVVNHALFLQNFIHKYASLHPLPPSLLLLLPRESLIPPLGPLIPRNTPFMYIIEASSSQYYLCCRIPFFCYPTLYPFITLRSNKALEPYPTFIIRGSFLYILPINISILISLWKWVFFTQRSEPANILVEPLSIK